MNGEILVRERRDVGKCNAASSRRGREDLSFKATAFQ